MVASKSTSTVAGALVRDTTYLGPDGKFKPGNPGGGGTLIKSVQSWRKALYAAVTPEDILQITRKLVKLARKGVPWAMTEVLDRCLGKASVSINVGAEGEGGREYDERAAADARRITAILLMSSLPEGALGQTPKLLTTPEPPLLHADTATGHTPTVAGQTAPQGRVGSIRGEVDGNPAQSEKKIGAAAATGVNLGREERESAVLALESHAPSGEAGQGRASAAEVLGVEQEQAAQAALVAPAVKAKRKQYRKHAKHCCCWPGCVKPVMKRGQGCNWHSRSVAEADRLRRVARAEAEAAQAVRVLGQVPGSVAVLGQPGRPDGCSCGPVACLPPAESGPPGASTSVLASPGAPRGLPGAAGGRPAVPGGHHLAGAAQDNAARPPSCPPGPGGGENAVP
jgi:hypothetical protein